MVWRYGEILKSLYSPTAGVPATPSTPSNSVVSKRLDVVEQLLRDILSRLDDSELRSLVSSLAQEIKSHGSEIEKLRRTVSELKQEVQSMQERLESCSFPDVDSLFSDLKAHIDERISQVESLISELSSSMQYSGFQPITSVGDPVRIGSSTNLRIPRRGGGKKKK